MTSRRIGPLLARRLAARRLAVLIVVVVCVGLVDGNGGGATGGFGAPNRANPER